MSSDQDRATELAQQWTTDLRRTGGVRVHFDTDADRDLYQAAAQQAGRLLGRPVETTVIGNQVHVLITDWAQHPLEARLEDARTRNAIDAAFDAADDPSPPHTASVTPLRPER
ncbi:hypothetical protein ETD83_01485 [Actinomadura soli]|uniref:Uncharacterized protein n=1 Tax=Actinomadura soli TaxID=2508997 RepID=A0A5C4JKP3_9ACTN|nr:hypothetical protein [Actinomadura soli]TMR07291.1 hypothetical protein ETD83_01485 [Actinomadura soli]